MSQTLDNTGVDMGDVLAEIREVRAENRSNSAELRSTIVAHEQKDDHRFEQTAEVTGETKSSMDKASGSLSAIRWMLIGLAGMESAIHIWEALHK